jgi:hypothetical protein
MAALTSAAIKAHADVQNIRISGDIRIRGYYLNNIAGDAVEDQSRKDDSYISQRTRVTVEADLEDHVLVVVTLKAEGLWGFDNSSVSSSGAGNGSIETVEPDDQETLDADGRVNRLWDVGLTEAFVQFSEMFYSPATLKIGRQYLNYGRGLIFSSVEQEYNFDAARLVLDYYPLTIDVVYAKADENSTFGNQDTALEGIVGRDTDVVFVNARYELSDSILKDIEAYFGYTANNRATGGETRVPPTGATTPPFGGADSPLIVGLRADITPLDALEMWAEGVYEWGSATVGEDIQAFLANAGFKFSLKDTQMTPVINGTFTYASGGGSDAQHHFRPWFDYVDGYNGYLMQPYLSNIMIFNLGASIKPYENTTLSLQAYYYMQPDTVPGNPGIGLIGNPNSDFGGLGYSPSGSSKNVGWEFDGIVGYDYSKDVRFQFVYAVFIPENAYTVFASDSMAHLVRAEVNARF